MGRKFKSAEEIAKWDECYQYFNREIMGRTVPLPRPVVMRLDGIVQGEVFNTGNAKYGFYGYEALLATLMYCKQTILDVFKRKTFKTEVKKMMYACSIIERNIPDVYERMERHRKEQEKLWDVALMHKTDTLNKAEHKVIDKKLNEKYEELW